MSTTSACTATTHPAHAACTHAHVGKQKQKSSPYTNSPSTAQSLLFSDIDMFEQRQSQSVARTVSPGHPDPASHKRPARRPCRRAPATASAAPGTSAMHTVTRTVPAAAPAIACRPRARPRRRARIRRPAPSCTGAEILHRRPSQQLQTCVRWPGGRMLDDHRLLRGAVTPYQYTHHVRSQRVLPGPPLRCLPSSCSGGR